MAQSLTFTIKFNIDPPNVQQALDAVNASLKNVGVSITNVAETSPKLNALDDPFTKIGLRLNGIQNLFSILTSSFGSIVAASNSAEASAVKLSQALQNQGVFTEALVTDLKAFASARQDATGIDDDATIAIMGQLTAMGLHGQALKDATVSVQDLATLMDGDMNSAVRVVADAFSGNTGMLKRYIKGLDETDIKQRGTISIIEQLQRAIGGQAEAFGNTGAGAMRKFQAAMDDFRQSMGSALNGVLTPLLGWMSGAAKWLGELPPSMQAVVVSGTALVATFALINSSAGILPYALGAVGGALLIFVNAIKEGNPLMAALAAALGVLGLAVLALNAKLLLTSATITTVLIPALTALKVAISTHPILLLVTGIVAVGAALWAMGSRTSEATEKLKALGEEAKTLGIPTLKERIAELTAEIEENNKVIETNIALKEQAAQLAGIVAQVDKQQIDNESQALRQRNAELQSEITILRDALKKAEAKRAAELKKEQEIQDPKIALKIEELRIQAMQDGTAKRLALLDLEKKKQFQQWDEENLSDKQRHDLKAGYTQAYAMKRTEILREAYDKERAAREQSAAEYYEYTQFLKKLDDDLALDSAQTDEEKYNLKRSFLEKEIADLELGPKTVEQEKRLAEARAELKKLNNAEILRLERERQDLEHQMRELRTGDIAEDNRREIETIRLKYNALRALAVKHGKDVSDINRAQQAEELAATRRQAEESRRLWAEQNKLAMIGVQSIGAGYQALWSNVVVGHRQAKDEGDAIWLAMKNTALNALGAILVRQIENLVITAAMRETDVASHAATETAKTAITQENAIVRVASAVWEGIKKAATWAWEAAQYVAGEIAKTAFAAAQAAVRIATTIAESTIKIGIWVAEQAAFIAKEVAMTAVFLAQQAIRVAAALAEVAATIAKAVANFIVSLGPFGLFGAAGAIAAGVALLAGIKKAFGFAKGGQFEKDQRGFIEGGQTEIIAPRRTFDEILRTEIVPTLVRTTQLVTLQYAPALAGAGAQPDRTLLKEIKGLRSDLRKKDFSPVFENFRDEERIVRTTLPGVQARIARRLR